MKLHYESYANAVLGLQSVSEDGLGDQHTYTHVKREMVLKWNFQPRKPTTTEAIVQQHITLLHAVMTHFVGSVEIVAPNGHPLTPANLANLGRPDQYYKINYTPPRNSQPASYAIYHRVHSTVALSKIRNHASVSSTLALYQCWVKLHHWKEEFQDITQLGWMVRLNPGHSHDDHVTEEIRDHIKKTTSVRDSRLPRFVATQTTVSVICEGKQVRAQAYGIQCRKSDTTVLLSRFLKAYPEGGFVSYSAKRNNTRGGYANAIGAQKTYLADSRVIAIEGIHIDTMWQFENYLKAHCDNMILHVWKTNRSETVGRFHLEATSSTYVALGRLMATQLPTIYQAFLDNISVIPLVCPSSPDHSHTTRVTYGYTG
jgi:hypothetical protein